ncbi:hypothetical protein HPMBJEAJ_00243 [Aeromonas phage avDM6]|nr:hypothetical protein HPMBJEAJ_00243 [Aeromonas phage avDM6]
MIKDQYPHIYFSKCSTSIWRNTNGRDQEALPKNKPLDFLNEQCELVNTGKKYFVCTCCGIAKDKEQLIGNVFAGYYCYECHDKDPVIQRNLRDSKKSGFYD